MRLGFGRSPLISTLPPLTASAASARVLKKRAAQSHLSRRIESSCSCIGGALLRPGKARDGLIGERLVMRHIDLQRRDRDISFVYSHAIRAIVLDVAEIVTADPIVFFAARVDALDD